MEHTLISARKVFNTPRPDKLKPPATSRATAKLLHKNTLDFI